MARTRAVDRALHTHGRGPWVATGVIALLGVVLLLWFLSPTERRRRALMREVAIGADTAAVAGVLGAPTRCPHRATEQIRRSFPEDWSARAVETALSRMQFGTRERWLYGINPRRPIGCDAAEGHTEVGIGVDGRVLWTVDITGKTPIRLPEDYSPSGAGS